MNEPNEIFTLLTSKDKKEIKESVKSLIVKQIERDLENYCEYEYIINCEEVQDKVNDALEELIQEIINEHRQEIEKCILNNFNKTSK